ncbi:Permeases of the major facilitator superfamily [Methanosarcina siciliae C2J]|uniref:Permeases of the major facilitator superfamily n=1 Tax=Methanosarcina siciliae C2J TaxID=1434118 RepID=A0A0E3PS94_9EURY|nr:archaeosortase C [Methanosarcina siciliae]AKB38017.1 Permeases of the major facilitator superfamily [Methanosarcina siciliae C2J]
MMDDENKNLVLILLVLALFTGMAVEVSEGSTAVGVSLFLISVFLLTRINFKQLGSSGLLKKSKTYFVIGIFIVSADLYYNFKHGGELGTLDVMTLFFGASLIGTQLQNPQIERVSRFGMYISSVFVVLYLIFYTMFAFLNIDFLHKFDHYLILLPTVKLLGLAGIPLEVIATETVRVSGVEEMTVIIGGPCSGLYSMFLLIGIVFGYSRIEKMEVKKTLMILGFCVVVAYIANLFRVIALYFAAYYYGQETMMLLHTHLGWIIFAAVAAGIMYFIELKS